MSYMGYKASMPTIKQAKTSVSVEAAVTFCPRCPELTCDDSGYQFNGQKCLVYSGFNWSVDCGNHTEYWRMVLKSPEGKVLHTVTWWN